MDNTTQWSIIWDTSLLPPQEMLPSSSFFHTASHSNTACSNSEHLFGFSPCAPALHWEDAIADEQAAADSVDTGSFNEVGEDFSTLFSVEELETFV